MYVRLCCLIRSSDTSKYSRFIVGNDSVYKSFHFSSRDPVDKKLDGGNQEKLQPQLGSCACEPQNAPSCLKSLKLQLWYSSHYTINGVSRVSHTWARTQGRHPHQTWCHHFITCTSLPFYWDLDRICPERKIPPILSPKGWGRGHLGLPHPPSSLYFKYLLLESTWQGEVEESTLPGLISTTTWSTTEEVGKGGACRHITPAPAGWHSTAVVKNLRHNQSPTREGARRDQGPES